MFGSRSFSKRLFLAINLPKAVRKEAAVFQQLLKKQFLGKKVSWVREENFHLTLVFLGEVSFPQEERLISLLEEIKAAPFFLKLSLPGAFPSLDKPRVIWVGVTGEEEKLRFLYQQLLKRLKKEGVVLGGDYLPHVTLGRIRGFSKQKLVLNKKFYQLAKSNKKFFVQKFFLMESKRGPEGVEYFPVKEFTLK